MKNKQPIGQRQNPHIQVLFNSKPKSYWWIILLVIIMIALLINSQ